MPELLVSIIVPCYNAEEWIAATLEACLQQTYKPIEIIVVDDGSTDQSLSVMRAYEDRVLVLTGPNKGGCSARNRGFEASRGDYILFLDADDMITLDLIESMVSGIRGAENTIAASRWAYLHFENGEWVPKVETYARNRLPPDGDYILGWLTDWGLITNAVLYPRSLVIAIGGWDEQLFATQDNDFMLRAILAGAKFKHVDRGYAYYRRFGSSRTTVSTAKSLKALHSRFRVWEKLEQQLKARGLLEKYALPLSQSYLVVSAMSFDVDRSLARECMRHAVALAGNRAYQGSRWNKLFSTLLGFERKELLARQLLKVGIGTSFRRKAGSS